MGFFDWFRRKPQVAKSEDLGQGIPQGGGWEVLEGIITLSQGKLSNEIWNNLSARELAEIYKRQAVVYACVRRIVTAFNEARPIVRQEVSDGFEELPDHLMTRVLKRPNPKMSHDEYMGIVLGNLLLTGEAYVYEERNNSGFIESVWPVPTSWITPKLDKAGQQIVAYEVWQGQGRPPMEILPQDMTVLLFADPNNPNRGVGPLQAAQRDEQTDQERANYIIEMLENLKVPGMVFKQPEGWTEKQKKEIRAALDDKAGKGKRGSSLFMEGEHAGVEMIAPLKDLDWPGLCALSETRICAAFGVPPIIVGVRSGLESATYSNFEQAEKTFYKSTMVPLWKTMGTGQTRGFMLNEDEDSSIEIYYDVSEIKQLQDDADKVAERSIKLFQGGLIDRDEARDMNGLPPMEKEVYGKVILQPIGMKEIHVNEDPPPDPVLPTDKGQFGFEEDNPEDQDVGNEDDPPANGNGKSRLGALAK